jgi:16S rRNA (uracil1498-N3)-methyltransferase
MALPRFFVPDLDHAARVARLPSSEAQHLTRVLRLRVGDAVNVFDGRGREWAGRVAEVTRAGATVSLGDAVDPIPEPPVRVTLAVGLLKGDQMDNVVRDATMLGAAAIVPVSSAHVAVPAAGRKSDTAVERWARVAAASAKQCGRAVVPSVSAVTRFEDVIAGRPVGATIMCVEPARAAGGPGSLPPPPSSDVLVLVGPEGGWSESEIGQAVYSGARLLHLGPRTLRAETAPTVVLSVLWSAWGW